MLLCAAVMAACSEKTSPPVPVTVAGVSPNNGPLAGGTAVTITGTNFVHVTAVAIGGGTLRNLTVVTSMELTGQTPAGASSGAVDVVVGSSSDGTGTCAGCFTYNAPPTVTSVSPTNGPLARETAVTITGTDFPPTVDSVRVGIGRLGGLVRVSSTQLTGTTPAGGTPGTVDVTVYTASAGNGTCTGCFTFNPAAPWTNLTAGGAYTCGLTSTGAAYCWGLDNLGQLGDGSTGNRSTPVAVSGRLTVSRLAASYQVTCGLTSAGAAFCWGENGVGQLGTSAAVGLCDGDVFSPPAKCSTVPVAVAGGLTFASLTAGAGHTCGVTSSGVAYCWGDNWSGQLGTDSTPDNQCGSYYGGPSGRCSTVPVPVAGGLTFASLTAGSGHTCGVTSSGAAYCWGDNSAGRLGDGSTTQRATPVPVAGGLTFANLAAGFFHTCGVTSSGAAYCWGDNSNGELGDLSTMQRATPVPVAGGLTFVSVTAGYQYTCGVTSGGAAYCWGYNVDGELGDGSTTQRTTPVAVAGGLTFASLTAGAGHTCGVTNTGSAYCWGSNYAGQLGDGSTTYRPTPVAVVSP